MKRLKLIFVILLCILTVSCPSVIEKLRCPIETGPAGDAQALNWKPGPKHSEDKYNSKIIDCGGETIQNYFITEDGVTLQNCKIYGHVFVYRKDYGVSVHKYQGESRKANYVSFIRNNSPTRFIIKDSDIIATGDTPLRLGAGTTFGKIINVTISGNTGSGTAVYISAESHGHYFDNLRIRDIKLGREAIAIDASDNITIINSVIHGRIHLYRNCGEQGVIRHTTPSFNLITNNTFFDTGKFNVIVGSRGMYDVKCYCNEDSWGPDNAMFGSRISDLDNAHDNIITNNKGTGEPFIAPVGNINNEVSL